MYIGAINIRLSLQIWLGWRRFVSHVSYKIQYLMEEPKHNALFNTASGVVCAISLKETKLMAINEINLFIFKCWFKTSYCVIICLVTILILYFLKMPEKHFQILVDNSQ